jgi:hypothetical protein
VVVADSATTSGMQILRGVIALAFVLGLFAVLGWGLIRGLDELQSGVAAAVVTASATLLISVTSLIYSKRWEQRRLIEQAQREQKLPVYDEFIGFWFRATFFHDSDASPTEAEWKSFVGDSAQKLSLWASEDVIHAYNRFRQVAGVVSADQLESNPGPLLAFEQMLFAIRRDLGHENKGLSAADLLRLYINDIDDFMPATGGASSSST